MGSLEQKMWLKDFLPNTFPTARVLLKSYNASSVVKSATIEVRQHAENLLSQPNTKRKVR